jgi:hypothetical protein
MKTKFSIKIIILLPILIILLLGLFSFGLLVLQKTIEKPEFMGFIVSYMFIWLSLGFISVLINEFRSFEIRNEKLIMTKPLIGKKTEIDLRSIKYKTYDWDRMYGTKMEGILIRTDSKRTIQINQANFRNASDFIEKIKESGIYEENMKPNFDSKNLRIFLILGAILLILIGIFKWIN